LSFVPDFMVASLRLLTVLHRARPLPERQLPEPRRGMVRPGLCHRLQTTAQEDSWQPLRRPLEGASLQVGFLVQ
jgi:hypothetical protein